MKIGEIDSQNVTAHDPLTIDKIRGCAEVILNNLGFPAPTDQQTEMMLYSHLLIADTVIALAVADGYQSTKQGVTF